MKPVKLYGAGILHLPIGFHGASSLEDQIDILYSAADAPNTSKTLAEKYLKLVKKLQKNPMKLNTSRNTAKSGKHIRHIKNSSEALDEAKDMVKRFHGREPKAVLDLVEEENYTKDLAILGQLMELNILKEGKVLAYVPIIFARDQDIEDDILDDLIQVCSDPKGENIYFYGGDQELDIDKLQKQGLYNEIEQKKDVIVVGPVFSIVYWTDKHHLEGPKYQEKGSAYEHNFGERADEGEEGEMPILLYNCRNRKLILSGGSYEVRDEGIYN